MAIVADLYDLTAAEFLLMLSLNRKTGKLTAASSEHKVVIAFRAGSIVYAASTVVRERIGSILVGRGLVSEEQLREALATHAAEGHVRHLGNILIEMGAITPEAITAVVGDQFQRVVSELLSWPDGMISFTRLAIPDLGAVHVDPREILVDMGFETEQLVLGSMTELEDSANAPGAGPARVDVLAVSPDARDLMRSMFDEMSSLSFSLTAEVTLEILSTAAQVVDRAVLFLVSPEGISGAGGFGVKSGAQSAEAVVRSCVLPRDRPSLFTQVVASAEPFVGAIEDSPCHRLFFEQLGGIEPTEAVAVPLVYGGQVAAILYGDNAVSGRPLTGTEQVEEMMSRLSASLEAVG